MYSISVSFDAESCTTRTDIPAVIGVSTDGSTNAPSGSTMPASSSTSPTVLASVYSTSWPDGSATVTACA